jgi:hypothetical protein
MSRSQDRHEVDKQLLGAFDTMKQILASLERAIGENTKCPAEACFPPHIPDVLTVLAYACSRNLHAPGARPLHPSFPEWRRADASCCEDIS